MSYEKRINGFTITWHKMHVTTIGSLNLYNKSIFFCWKRGVVHYFNHPFITSCLHRARLFL